MAASSSSAELPAVTSPIFTRRVTLCTHISPAHLVQPLEGVREQLNRSMLRYVEQLGGVLVHYSGLRFTQPLGRISGDQPEVHVRVSFNATYFAPKVGDYLDGTVSRIGGDHIALLVLGVFNGSVAHPTGARRGQIKQDDKGVVFVVRNVTHANGLISMHGELAEPGSFRPMPADGALPKPAVVRRGDAAARQRSAQPPPTAAASAVSSAAAAAAPKSALAAAAASAASSAAPAEPSAPAAAKAVVASSGSPTDGPAGTKAKRSKEEKEERKRRKAEKAAAAATGKAAPAAAAAVPVPVAPDSAPPPKREREGEEEAEAAGGNGAEKGTKHRHTPEEREAKKRRKAEREAARKLAEA
jgi:DNA-directed RNA polymerase subunit E'/Rpb7